MMVVAVIPTYRASQTVALVAEQALEVCDHVVIVDDNCPEQSGEMVKHLQGSITTIFRESNGGVGAASKTGFLHALELGADIIVKIDADGQMNPKLVPELIEPVKKGAADYSKGTRFDSPEDLEGMPWLRLIGNSGLSLINKASSGYWSVNDPTNGFIAFSRKFALQLIWGKVADDYFFESDLLFRSRLIGARISQMRMRAVYASEKSGLRPIRVMLPFLGSHSKNCAKRIIYMYFVREWNLGTIYLMTSVVAIAVGLSSSLLALSQAEVGSVGTGTAVLASLGFILWVQFITQFLTVDVTSEPKPG